jgi:GAF domain-containing protein
MAEKMITSTENEADSAALHARIAELEAQEEKPRRSEQVQAALYRIAAASSAEDMHAFYAEIHQIVGEVLCVDSFSVVLYDETARAISFPYLVDRSVQEPIPPQSLHGAFGRTPTAYLLHSGEPLHAPPERIDELVRKGEVEMFGPPSVDWLGVPLRSEGETVGALVVQTYTEHVRYTAADSDLLIFIAHHVVSALTRARLRDETRRRSAELEVVNSVGEALARQLDFQGVIDVVGDKLREVFDAQVLSILLYDPAGASLTEVYGFERGERQDAGVMPLGPGFGSHIITTRQPLLINEDILQRATDFNSSLLGGEVPKSYLGVPILNGDEVTGVVSIQNLDREHAFSDSDVRLLSTIATSMGVALENARLFDEERQRAAELAVINTVAEGLAQELNFQGIVDLVGDKSRRFLMPRSSP